MKTYIIEYKIITAMQMEVEAEGMYEALRKAEADAGYGTDLYSYGAEYKIVDVKEADND